MEDNRNERMRWCKMVEEKKRQRVNKCKKGQEERGKRDDRGSPREIGVPSPT